MIKKNFILIIGIILTSCAQNIYKVAYPTLSDGKYDTEFPYKNCSSQLEEISKSVKLLNCMAFYKTYVFSENSFRIPLDAEPGLWKVHARSGANFDDAEITIVGDTEEGMVILVESIVPSPGGDIVTISGYGAVVSQQVIITIFDGDDVEVEELTIFSTGIGEFSTIWLVSDDITPGTYTIRAVDVLDESETTVVIE